MVIVSPHGRLPHRGLSSLLTCRWWMVADKMSVFENSFCGFLLTILSYIIIAVTMPFSLCLCLKVSRFWRKGTFTRSIQSYHIWRDCMCSVKITFFRVSLVYMAHHGVKSWLIHIRSYYESSTPCFIKSWPICIFLNNIFKCLSISMKTTSLYSSGHLWFAIIYFINIFLLRNIFALVELHI